MPEVRPADGSIADRVSRKDARGSAHIRVCSVRLRRDCRLPIQLKAALDFWPRWSTFRSVPDPHRPVAKSYLFRTWQAAWTATRVRAQLGSNGIHLPPGPILREAISVMPIPVAPKWAWRPERMSVRRGEPDAPHPGCDCDGFGAGRMRG
jgi:hypothetical protein